MLLPHLCISRIYYRFVIENIRSFSRFPEAGIRGALGYYLYDEYKNSRNNPAQAQTLAKLYNALLGPLPGEPMPPEGPQPRSINIRFFPLPQEPQKMGFEITFFGESISLSKLLENALCILGEEGIGCHANRFYIDGILPARSFDLSEIQPHCMQSATLNFYSPTSFRLNRKELKSWNLEMFSKNLVQRIELLCKAYGQLDESDWNSESLVQELMQMDSHAEISIENRARLSTRQKKRLDYSGFTGQVHLEKISSKAAMLLSFGEATGVGKNTTFGGGRYSLVTD